LKTIQEAGTAKDSAQAAVLAAQTARDVSGEAKEEANAAMGRATAVFGVATEAGKSARGALTMAGDAKAEVAAVKSNIDAVDAKYAPRTLSKAKRGILIELLRKARTKSKEPVVIEVSVDAPDASAYAVEIAGAFNDPSTGWHAKVEGLRFNTEGKKGVFLLFHSASSYPLWGGELQIVLQSAGIGGDGATNPEIPAGEMRILIAAKP
jgi:hypothetical protein